MAIKTKEVIIDDVNSRDHGKKFLITEPNAFKAERMFLKLTALTKGTLNISLLFDSEEGIALWDSFLDYVLIYPTPTADLTRKIDSEDIESFQTLTLLKSQVMALFTGF